MRTIEWSNAFKRDFKREMRGIHRNTLQAELTAVTELLANDVALPQKMRDHDLVGDWAGYRECHIKPDLLLIYKKVDEDILRMARLGSHSELF
ncbi:type II toxin-antitoxin system YafQ family toxin [Salmonella enterica]|nr:type II toxin-antitoxin system YafQ family toxin [Salmonella enterica]